MNSSSKIENGVAHPKNILMKMVFRALEPWCIMAAHHDALIVSFTWTRFVIFDYSIGPSTLRMNSSWSKMHEDEFILVTRSSRESVYIDFQGVTLASLGGRFGSTYGWGRVVAPVAPQDTP